MTFRVSLHTAFHLVSMVTAQDFLNLELLLVIPVTFRVSSRTAFHLVSMVTAQDFLKFRITVSCTPDKDILDFTLGLKILSYPCYLT